MIYRAKGILPPLAVACGLAFAPPVLAGSLVVLPQAGALAINAAHWLVGEMRGYVSQTLASRAASLRAIAVEGNHMIVEARRLSPESQPFRAFSGPRKKQPLR